METAAVVTPRLSSSACRSCTPGHSPEKSFASNGTIVQGSWIVGPSNADNSYTRWKWQGCKEWNNFISPRGMKMSSPTCNLYSMYNAVMRKPFVTVVKKGIARMIHGNLVLFRFVWKAHQALMKSYNIVLGGLAKGFHGSYRSTLATHVLFDTQQA